VPETLPNFFSGEMMISEKRRAASRAWYHRNKEQARATAKAWKLANPERVDIMRRKHLRKKYGATNPTGETKVGLCEVCEELKKLYYDHDHATGEFRGWLCNTCNMLLGKFEKMMQKGLDIKFKQYLGRRNCLK
jgi:hypothetical protein